MWIEIISTVGDGKVCESLSARRVWIEIFPVIGFVPSTIVTLCEESVD